MEVRAAAAAVLAAYFAGLGLGSYVLGRLLAQVRRPLRVYAGLEALVAAGALVSFPLASAAAPLAVLTTGGVAPATLRPLMEALAAFATLALPTFAMGGTLPVLARLSDASGRRLGLGVGLLYAVNTAGAALGALAVPLVVLPLLGARGGLLAAVIANVAVAAIAWTMDGPSLNGSESEASRLDGPALSWTHSCRPAGRRFRPGHVRPASAVEPRLRSSPRELHAFLRADRRSLRPRPRPRGRGLASRSAAGTCRRR